MCDPMAPQQLAQIIAAHLSQSASFPLVCRFPQTAFESWFRLEIAQALLTSGQLPQAAVEFNYAYPLCPNRKADLHIPQIGIFELKCFCPADANKKEKFPEQVIRLQKHIDQGLEIAGYKFVTLQGYTAQTLQNRRQFITDSTPGWQQIDFRPLLHQPTNFEVLLLAYTSRQTAKTAVGATA